MPLFLTSSPRTCLCRACEHENQNDSSTFCQLLTHAHVLDVCCGRSRGSLWQKGDSSGAWQHLVRIDIDCDRWAHRTF
eukprot:4700418-Pleurochrysis_carterae.AAC.1